MNNTAKYGPHPPTHILACRYEQHSQMWPTPTHSHISMHKRTTQPNMAHTHPPTYYHAETNNTAKYGPHPATRISTCRNEQHSQIWPTPTHPHINMQKRTTQPRLSFPTKSHTHIHSYTQLHSHTSFLATSSAKADPALNSSWYSLHVMHEVMHTWLEQLYLFSQPTLLWKIAGTGCT